MPEEKPPNEIDVHIETHRYKYSPEPKEASVAELEEVIEATRKLLGPLQQKVDALKAIISNKEYEIKEKLQEALRGIMCRFVPLEVEHKGDSVSMDQEKYSHSFSFTHSRAWYKSSEVMGLIADTIEEKFKEVCEQNSVDPSIMQIFVRTHKYNDIRGSFPFCERHRDHIIIQITREGIVDAFKIFKMIIDETADNFRKFKVELVPKKVKGDCWKKFRTVYEIPKAAGAS